MSYWARSADSADWHAIPGSPHDSVRRPRCGAIQWARQPDDATRPIAAGGVFGPVCNRCAREEGL